MSTRPCPRHLRRRTFLTVPPVLALLAACSVNDTSPTPPTDAPVDPASPMSSRVRPRVLQLADAPYVGAAVTACDELGASLLAHALSEDPQTNAVVCPAGTGLTLALLYAGAGIPDVPKEVDRLLGFDSTASYPEPEGLPQVRDTAWSALLQSLMRLDVEDVSELAGVGAGTLPDTALLHIASRLLAVRPDDDSAVKIQQQYLDDLTRWYRASAAQASRDQAQDSLNAWASTHTGGLVPASAIEVADTTRLVLQNAVLLAARWSRPFDAALTAEDGEFRHPDSTTSPAALMSQVERFAVVSGEGWRALRMPYADSDDELVMDIVLPDDVVHPADLPAETWAAASALLEADKGDSQVRVDLVLPRLDLSPGTMNLLDALASIGVTLGDVPHIADDLRVDGAAQQVRLRVDEQGTVAAALTEVQLGVAAPVEEPAAPVSFVCDHPFVLRVVDRASGVCVIEAAVVSPAAG